MGDRGPVVGIGSLPDNHRVYLEGSREAQLLVFPLTKGQGAHRSRPLWEGRKEQCGEEEDASPRSSVQPGPEQNGGQSSQMTLMTKRVSAGEECWDRSLLHTETDFFSP